MFYSKGRQKLISVEQLDKDKKARVKTRGNAEGVTLGFNTSKKPEKPEMPSTRTKAEEILFRKF